MAKKKFDVIYDDDLRAVRRWAAWLGAGNFAAALVTAYLGDWKVAAAAVVWLMCCVAWRRSMAAQQATRDLVRVVEAGAHEARRWGIEAEGR